MFCVGNSLPPLLALFNLWIAMNRSQCLEDPVLAYGNCWCPAALLPSHSWKASSVPNCKVAVSTLNKNPACFWTTALCVKGTILLTSLHTFLIHALLSNFQPQGSYSEEKQTLESSPLPGPAETADHSCKQEHCPSPHPAILSPWLVMLGIYGTRELQNLQPQPPAPRAGPWSINTPERGWKCASCAVAWPRKAQEHQTPLAMPALQQQSPICATGSTHGMRREAAAPAAGERGAGHRGPAHTPVSSTARGGKGFCILSRAQTSEGVLQCCLTLQIRANFSRLSQCTAFVDISYTN